MNTSEDFLFAAANQAAINAKQTEEVNKVLALAMKGYDGKDDGTVSLKGRIDACKSDVRAMDMKRAAFISLVNSPNTTSLEVDGSGLALLNEQADIIASQMELIEKCFVVVKARNVQAALGEREQQVNEMKHGRLRRLYTSLQRIAAKQTEETRKAFIVILGDKEKKEKRARLPPPPFVHPVSHSPVTEEGDETHGEEEEEEEEAPPPPKKKYRMDKEEEDATTKIDDGFDILRDYLKENDCDPFDSEQGALEFRRKFTKTKITGANNLQYTVVVQNFFTASLGRSFLAGNLTKELRKQLFSKLVEKLTNKMKYELRQEDSFICKSLALWKKEVEK